MGGTIIPVSAGVIPSPAQGARIPTLPERALTCGDGASQRIVPWPTTPGSVATFPHSRKNAGHSIADAGQSGSLRDAAHGVN